MSYPPLPEDLQDHGLVDYELMELWRDLIVELMDPAYLGRAHPHRRTFDAGCRGPLCRKALREYSRRRNGTGASERFKYVDQIIDYWQPLAVDQIDAARTVIIHQLTG